MVSDHLAVDSNNDKVQIAADQGMYSMQHFLVCVSKLQVQRANTSQSLE